MSLQRINEKRKHERQSCKSCREFKSWAIPQGTSTIFCFLLSIQNFVTTRLWRVHRIDRSHAIIFCTVGLKSWITVSKTQTEVKATQDFQVLIDWKVGVQYQCELKILKCKYLLPNNTQDDVTKNHKGVWTQWKLILHFKVYSYSLKQKTTSHCVKLLQLPSLSYAVRIPSLKIC